jgi:signal transduction histidine kinase
LTEGTRAVAEGEFSHKLPVAGSDELSQLASDFNLMTDRLTELDQMKKDFVSHTSHELKTPLASMHETIRLLLDEIPGPLTEQQRRLLELNLQSGLRLSTLIGNLLDLSRMEAGVIEYSMHRQDLRMLLRTAAAEFEIPMKEKLIQFEMRLPEEPVMADFDTDRMIQVVDNLLGNALKFSPPGSTVRLYLRRDNAVPAAAYSSGFSRVTGEPQEGGFAIIAISDTGPGVPTNEKRGIFGKFYQVRRSANKLAGQGAGLGLAISRTIVEAHRGAIWVEDNPGGGSTFCVLLCAGTAKDHAVSRASAPI